MNYDVLIVDDIVNNIQLLKKIFATQGYHVRQANNGSHALEEIAKKKPDLILLDINMPGINGYQVCEIIKSNSITQEIPIIFLSGCDRSDDKIRAFNLGGADYITKPFCPEEVLIRTKNQLTIQEQKKQLINQNLSLQKEIEKRKKAEASLRQANKKLEELVIIDDLTKVSNRRHFNQYLSQQWQQMKREQKPLSLLICDIDHFKLYNDTYGHQKGDECLRCVAQILSSIIKRKTDLLARYGGEEFAMILPYSSWQGALHLGKLICDQVLGAKIPHETSKTSEYVTLSVGASCTIPDQKNNSDDLLKNADKALYQSKTKGRNQVNVLLG